LKEALLVTQTRSKSFEEVKGHIKVLHKSSENDKAWKIE